MPFPPLSQTPLILAMAVVLVVMLAALAMIVVRGGRDQH
jgi:hypothetical protein